MHTDEADPPGAADLRAALAYAEQQMNAMVGKQLQLESDVTACRYLLQQRDRGFALLVALQGAFGHGATLEALCDQTVKGLCSTLRMDRTALLRGPGPRGPFQVVASVGLSAVQQLRAAVGVVPAAEDPLTYLLNRERSADEAAIPQLVRDLRGLLGLPFLVCAPADLGEEGCLLLVSGRGRELPPAYPKLGQADLDTQQALSGLLRSCAERLRSQAAERAQRVADEANRAKSLFLATMSHELRTPMNAVLGNAALLLSTPLSAEQLEYVHSIHLSGEVLLGIINDVLDFSKIEAGRLELEQQPFELRACLEEAVELVAPRAAQKPVDLYCLLDPALPAWVVGDSHRLRQVLLNLLSNAVKFTPRGEVALLAGPASGTVRIACRDSGCGIPRHQQGQLFQPFVQVSNNVTRSHEGTGLGLAISRRLCQLMGGDLTVTSEEGRGSTFCAEVCLPAATGAALAGKGEALSGGLLGRRAQILAAPPGTGAALLGQLRGLGLLVVPSEAGPQTPEVVVIDATFAAGQEVARQLEEDPAAPPQLVLVPLGQRPGADSARRVLLQKPARTRAVLRALQSLLEQRPAQRPAESAPIERLVDVAPLRILVVDDNAMNRRLAQRMLQKMGYEVDLAEDGLQAVAQATATDYDLVLMDMQMPHLDGVGATQRIRAQRGASRAPYIVALTANTQREDRQVCAAAGMNDYLSKPLHLSALREVLLRAYADQATAEQGLPAGRGTEHHGASRDDT